MATNINTILSWFKTGLKPTQAQFWASWSSFWHKDEIIPQSAISNLTTVLNAKAEKSQFDAHKTDPNAHPNLILKARIIPIGGLLVFKVAPNENEAEKQPGDYCMGIVEDRFVNGNWNGANDQLKSSYE
ncbi:hypothetical protein [Flavobacterium sp. FlaQc-50]|uniref:hypothetical protein n=1 Tax=unclassified Flavobacterium TaxID=196869 RepID=UPI00375670ED